MGTFRNKANKPADIDENGITIHEPEFTPSKAFIAVGTGRCRNHQEVAFPEQFLKCDVSVTVGCAK